MSPPPKKKLFVRQYHKRETTIFGSVTKVVILVDVVMLIHGRKKIFD
jgi:hypothetical protein